MTDIALINADQALLDRIGKIARHHGWDSSRALRHVLERGLEASEGSVGVQFENGEAEALQAALEALGKIPDDPGFAMIGRLATSH